MNQLYLLNLKRVLATRYKENNIKSLFFSFFFLLLQVCMQDEVTNLCYYLSFFSSSFLCEQQSNMLYLSLCIVYYILFVFVCFFLSSCIFSICKEDSNVCVCHCVVFFLFCSLRVQYSSSRKHVVLFLQLFSFRIFFSVIFVPTEY